MVRRAKDADEQYEIKTDEENLLYICCTDVYTVRLAIDVYINRQME